jgi:probable F420-dependent oxidoreductase
VKFGIHLPQWGAGASREGVLDVARSVEASGLDSVWVGDHVVVPAEYSSVYPYRTAGTPFEPEDGFLDALTVLAAVAGATERVQIGTSVLVAPLRHPLALAKTVATLDILSNGRVILGVGSGWLREEFDALNVDFESRGKQYDECVQILKMLWRSGRASFAGKHFNFEEVYCEPRPVQPQGPPVWMGGTSRVALKRVGHIGDGWIAVGSRPDQISAGKKILDQCALDASRDEQEISIAVSSGISDDDERAIERLLILQAAGVDHVILSVFSQSPLELCRLVERFASKIKPVVESGRGHSVS